MVIPDEDASLTARLSQMKDCVGPRSTRHKRYISKQRMTVWGGEGNSMSQMDDERHFAVPLNNNSGIDDSSQEHSSHQIQVQQFDHGQMASDRSHFITSFKKSSNVSSTAVGRENQSNTQKY